LVERERRRVRLDTELLLARDLQSALMQPHIELMAEGDFGARTQSAEEVGGDFYKLIDLREAIGVLIGDVSSHGLSAAMLMAHVIAAAGIVAHGNREPERALRKLLGVIGGELQRAEMHVALFYAVISPRRKTLRYANAGHPQAFLVRGADGESTRLAATAPPLGLGDSTIAGASVPWAAGQDLLCLFSDGFSETESAGGERYGEERLLRLVKRNLRASAAGIVDAAFEDVESFAPGTAADDRTLVLVRR
jgi:sigma-B regulation protein RsbU (phosphoserine phosphatase)